MDDLKKIVDSIRQDINSRNEVVIELYRNEKLRALVHQYIKANKGSSEDAESLLTFGIIAFVKQCSRMNFELKTSAQSYIFAIIRNEWKRIKTEAGKIISIETSSHLDHQDYNTPEYLFLSEEKKKLLSTTLSKLDAKCRDVLDMWSKNWKMREIAVSMNYKSEGMARKKKHECMQKLIQLVNKFKI